jgi:hypothetical protein
MGRANGAFMASIHLKKAHRNGCVARSDNILAPITINSDGDVSKHIAMLT